jgi:hypothetical protein
MLRQRLRWMALLAVGLSAGARPGAAATILSGIEDWAGSTGIERNGDFNDLIFQITGNVAFNAPGGIFNNLTPSVVNENGTVFWDNPSGDGLDQNIGFYMLGLGNLQYLAASGGGSVNTVTFQAQGPLTIRVLGGITANTALNTLGWYDPSNPGTLHQLFSGATAGATAMFDPSATFALYSSNGWGATFSSVSAANVGESATQQHFAFFTPQAVVPEPAYGWLAGLGVTLIALRSVHRRRSG